MCGDQLQRPCGVEGGMRSDLPSDRKRLHLPQLVILEEGSKNQAIRHVSLQGRDSVSFSRCLEGLETQKEPNESNTKPVRDPQTLKASILSLDLPCTTPRGTSLHLQDISSSWYPNTYPSPASTPWHSSFPSPC